VTDDAANNAELQELIAALEGGEPTLTALQGLASICTANKVIGISPPLSPMLDGPMSPSPFNGSQSMPFSHPDIWEKDKTFDRLFRALMQYLNGAKVLIMMFYTVCRVLITIPGFRKHRLCINFTF
jgi:CLIP-associating protein 1/2